MSASVKNLIVVGGPNSGKKTQSRLLSLKYGIGRVSAGEILREKMLKKCTDGMVVRRFIERGDLVPDHIVTPLISARLDEMKQNNPKQGWVIEGCPRTKNQAATLEEWRIKPTWFIILDIPDHVALQRSRNARLDTVTGDMYNVSHIPKLAPEVQQRLVQRLEDTNEQFLLRLKNFHQHIDSLIQHYQTLCVIMKVNADQEEQKVFEDMIKILETDKTVEKF